MHWGLNWAGALAAIDLAAWLSTTYLVIKVVIGFSLIIFVHELGHFLAAKWVGIRVDRFSIGFGQRLFGWRRGEGFTFGGRPNYTGEEVAQRGWGETDYCFKLLPLGGYVKMLGQDDIQINDKTGEIKLSEDPRAFTNKPVGQRMIVVSAGVIFNLVFAMLAFMCVFMMGRQTIAPRIAVLDADSPAAKAGLRSGDVITSANGQPVEGFRDIIIAQILAGDDAVRFRVERDGQPLPDELIMRRDDAREDTPLTSGVVPGRTTQLVEDKQLLGQLPGLQAGDVITHVGPEKVDSEADVFVAFSRQVIESGRPFVDLKVERPDPAQPGQKTVQTVQVAASMRLAAAQPPGENEGRGTPGNILGFVPRSMVYMVTAGDPAERAGLKAGDVVLQWGTVLSPLMNEIVESAENNADRPIAVAVQREGQTKELTITPRRPFRLFSSPKPRVGAAFSSEQLTPVVADTVADTPAAKLSIPRGALLVAIDGQPVRNWLEVVRSLRASAGKTVALRYRSDAMDARAPEAEGSLAVPSSVVNELGLPPQAMVVAIDGQTRAAAGDASSRLPSWLAVRALLEKRAGQTVTVRYQRAIGDLALQEGQFHVRADLANVDPWQMRIQFTNPDLPFKPLEKTIQTSNPVKAAQLGVTATRDTLVEVYRTIKTIAGSIGSKRSNTVQYISGPVGIVGFAIDRARAGSSELLYFLAFLSVNLAVLNFLPFPVVDGGLMVFLIIEKLKGKPLSVKTQMVATLVGLATIVLVFLLITIQDITKFFT